MIRICPLLNSVLKLRQREIEKKTKWEWKVKSSVMKFFNSYNQMLPDNSSGLEEQNMALLFHEVSDLLRKLSSATAATEGFLRPCYGSKKR